MLVFDSQSVKQNLPACIGGSIDISCNALPLRLFLMAVLVEAGV